MTSSDRTPVIVGIGLSPVAPQLDAVQHHVVAMRRALDDSGVRKADIDGYCCAGASKSSADPDDLAPMAEYLGIEHRWLDGTMVGGSSFEFFASELAPYVVAIVELDEGPRMMTNITGCAPEDVRIGMPVEAYTIVVDGGLGVPFWRPVGTG